MMSIIVVLFLIFNFQWLSHRYFDLVVNRPAGSCLPGRFFGPLVNYVGLESCRPGFHSQVLQRLPREAPGVIGVSAGTGEPGVSIL